MEDFITQIFCLVDDLYTAFVKKYGRLRAAGPEPTLSDSEVMTMLIVGEWLKLCEDKAIYRYFSQHWKALFPRLPNRSQFVRQAANLWSVMQNLQHTLADRLTGKEPELLIADGFPVKVCERVRARHSRCFKGEADFGYCASKETKFYGFYGQLLISAQGVPLNCSLAAANLDEREVVWDVLGKRQGDLLVDKGFIGPLFEADCLQQGIIPYVPVRCNMKARWTDAFRRWASKTRRRIETVIGQLVSYFDFGRCKCRKTLQLTARVARKLLAYTVGMFLQKEAGKSPTQLQDFVPV